MGIELDEEEDENRPMGKSPQAGNRRSKFSRELNENQQVGLVKGSELHPGGLPWLGPRAQSKPKV